VKIVSKISIGEIDEGVPQMPTVQKTGLASTVGTPSCIVIPQILAVHEIKNSPYKQVATKAAGPAGELQYLLIVSTSKSSGLLETYR
jgi:hypothetical protein